MQTIFRTLEGATPVNTAGSSVMMIGMILVMVAVFYFFLYRPQKKQEKETQEMRNSIEIGDVISIGNKEALYYCFPPAEVSVTKARIAAELLYEMNKA